LRPEEIYGVVSADGRKPFERARHHRRRLVDGSEFDRIQEAVLRPDP